MNSKIYASLALCLLLVSCAQVSTEWVDLEELSKKLDVNTAFVPYQYSEDGAAAQAAISSRLDYLDAELTKSDTIGNAGPMRTTGTNAVGLAKGIISMWDAGQSVSYCGTYLSVDQNGNPIRLSGRIILPKNKKPNRIMVVSHFTIGSNEEAPSQSFPLEGILASRGLAVIVPDYIGYGVTADYVHPYLCSDVTATNVLDMYQACLPFLKLIDKMPAHDEVILMGYSQGGATTMAVARKVEYEHPEIKLKLILAGGGPYDICVTYDKMIENDFTDYPCAIPMIIQGMNVGHNLGLDYSEFFQKKTLDNMDEWINSKCYTMAEITMLMGTKRLSEIMTQEACNKVSDGMTDLYTAMLDNSISTGYYPSAPLYLFHSIDDNVVPFENAEVLASTIQGYCNMQYNFGHYGNHVSGFLRFLLTSINLLYIGGDVDSKTLLNK